MTHLHFLAAFADFDRLRIANVRRRQNAFFSVIISTFENPIRSTSALNPWESASIRHVNFVKCFPQDEPGIERVVWSNAVGVYVSVCVCSLNLANKF